MPEYVIRLKNRGEEVPDKISEPSLLMKATINAAGYTPPPATLEALNVLSILNEEDFKELIELSVKELAQNTVESAEKYAMITHYDQTYHRLRDARLDHKTSQLALSKDWLKLIGLNAENCALIKAKNNDMEPTIKYSDLLFLDTSYKSFSKNGLYALMMDGKLIIRRIQQSFDFEQEQNNDNDRWGEPNYNLEIICDSPPYKSQRVSQKQANHLNFVGLIMWIVRHA